jgi:pimeloyl-ACP methyl ester carboxylesterase
MKYPGLCILLLSFVIVLSPVAQAQENWGSYVQAVPVKAYAGKKFRVQVSALIEGVEEDASAALWARVYRTHDEYGFFKIDNDNPMRAREWKSYFLEGTFDPDADTLMAGLIVQYNGTFYFDDFQISVESGRNKWRTIYQNDFEGKAPLLKPGIGEANQGINTLYTQTVTPIQGRKGHQAIVVTGKDVPNYGSSPTAGKYADVNGIKLYYEIYGTGAPLVVLHGNGGSISNAATHYPELIKKYKVIAVDSRAHGKSTDTDAPLTYEQMAADVNALLDQLQIDSTFIWGQSDGAILGLILAMDYPRKVKRVLAYGSNVQPDSSAIFYWGIQAIEKSLREGTDHEKKLNKLMIDYPHIPYARLKTIKAPVLVMAGDRDIIRPEHTLKIFQSIPKSQLCILPGSTHGGSWEKRELFLDLLNTFFLEPFTMPDTKSWF